MTADAAILEALAAQRPVPHRTMLIAAHPDDETVGLGAQLCRFDDLLLVHVTDGAPRDGKDAANHNFATLADYAGARHRELTAALIAGGVRARTICLDVADQEADRDLVGLTRRIADLLLAERPAAVITHAYEGGHPDHDSAAFSVHAACRLIEAPPVTLEMALYHRQDDRLVSGRFLSPMPEPRTDGAGAFPGQSLELNQTELRRKQRMIDSFATQRWLLVQLNAGVERLRLAPAYDFRHSPHPGTLHYETLGWGITGAGWCERAAAALMTLGLGGSQCL